MGIDIPLDRILQQYGLLDENLKAPKDEQDAIRLVVEANKRAEDNWFAQNYIRVYIDKHDLAKQLRKIIPYFYDRSRIWWLWNANRFAWEVVDDVELLKMIKKLCSSSTTKANERNEIIEAMKQEGRENMPLPIEKSWIQFKDTIVDWKTGKEFKASPRWFVTNPIPHELNSDRFTETPTMDRIFEEWVGKDYVKTLYEILAYSLIPDYPIHRLFCLIGEGMNGKSCYLRLLEKFIGRENITATELDTLINSRFEITKLHKKLVCVMGETNFAEISKTSIIKKLTGQDMIGFEYKNKNPFDDLNYSKIIIATNNLPATTDKTLGFYRRWCIIDFPNKFSEQKDILEEIPEEEYEILAVKSLTLLKDLMEKRKFHNEGTIEQRMEKYESKSNFLDKFMELFIQEDLEGYITKSDFLKKFMDWCKENRHRQMSETSLGLEMKKRGYESSKKNFSWMNDGKGGQARVWLGLKWKE